MKKLKWGLLIAALVVCLLAVGCGGKDAGDRTATSDEADGSKEKGEPYEFTFVSNGDGTCYISGVRFNEEFADEELTLTFPEKSPTGDTVTAVRYQAKENAVPMVISDEDFLHYIIQPLMIAEGKEPVQSTDALSEMSNQQYKETYSSAMRQLISFYGGLLGKKSIAGQKTDLLKKNLIAEYPFLQEHPDTEFWVFDTSAAETEIERENEYLMTIGMTPAKALQAEKRVGWEGSSEFAYPDNVIAMEFPETVTEISKSVFFCMSMQSLSLPDGVKVVGDTNGWSTFKSTPYYKEDSNWTDNVLYIGSVLVACKEDTTGSVTIKDGTTCIAGYAFSGCNSLESITIPNSVTGIGLPAFSGCTGLTSVTIGNSVTDIGDSAFYGCSGLTSITIPNSVTSIGEYAFSDCTGLTSVTIGNGVTSIGDYAFSGCTGLENITIGNSVTEIGNSAFRSCTSLTGVYITDIASWCKISFSDNPLGYAHNLYLNGELVKSVVIPDGVTFIADSAFSGCTNLTSVVIPNSVTRINGSAFRNCTGLTSITISDSVTAIGLDAFRNTVYCKDESNWTDGVLYIGNALIDCRQNKTGTVTIKDGTTCIATSAFTGCYRLTSITIPNSVTGIDDGTFADCTDLTGITIPGSVTSIGEGAFRHCSKLTSITIPDSVTDIGAGAFSDTAYYNDESNWADGVLYIGHALIDCNEDKTGTVTIKDGTTCIANRAFGGCSSLTSITFTGTKAQWEAVRKNDFAYVSNIDTIHCTDGDITVETDY